MYYRKNALQKNIFDFYILTEYFIKVWSTFSKVVGVGKVHKYFPFMQSKDSQTACCLRLINCYIGRFYGRCPNPQFLKKLSKLFCFWKDNLALAKFQSPTDTPLNHNLIKLSDYLFVSIICKAVTSLESIVPSSVISA